MILDKIKVIGHNLLCDPIKEEREIKGLVIPTQYEEKVSKAKILKIGEDIKNIPIGAIAYFNQYASISISIGDKDYLILKDEDIIAYELE